MVTSKRRVKRHRLFNKKCSLLLTLSTLRVCLRGFESPCITFNNNMWELTFLSLAWLNMLADFVEFNTFDMLACYPTEMENMLGQLNVQALSEEIQQFPYNGPCKTTEVQYPESMVNLGIA